MLKYFRRGAGSPWNWLLWWRLDRGEVYWQATRYADLRRGDSYKGLSVIFIVANALLFFLLTEINNDARAVLIDPALMLVLALFIHFGQRWAMVGAMLIWTLEKIGQAIVHPGFLLVGLIWWAVFMHAFYMALLVERRRAIPGAEVETLDKDVAIFLRHAGRLLEIAARQIWAGVRLASRNAWRYARLRAALAKRSNR